MKKILITGGTGALGRAFVEYINQHFDCELIVLSRKPSKNPARHSHIVCDIGDYQGMTAILKGFQPDIVFHLATAFSGDLQDLYTTNVAHSKHILEWVKHSDGNTRVVLIGSAAEYGCVKMEENPIQENHMLAPISSYGVSKAWQTQLVSFYQGAGVDVMCARIFNLYGEGISNHLFFGRLQHQIDEVLAGRKSVIQLGALTATRDYISTEEAARQLFAIAKYGESGEVYHIASGIPITIREILACQLEKYGLNMDIVQSSTDFSNHQGFDIPIIYADISKTKQLLTQELAYA